MLTAPTLLDRDYNPAMETLKSSQSFQQYCSDLYSAADTADLTLAVAGAPGQRVSAHALILALLGDRVKRLLAEDVDMVIFPEHSEKDVLSLMDYLYKGVKGYISLSLAQGHNTY